MNRTLKALDRMASALSSATAVAGIMSLPAINAFTASALDIPRASATVLTVEPS